MKFKIDLHTHTVFSAHAFSTVYEYIRVAKLKELDLIAITDHGPSLPDSSHESHFYNIRAIPSKVGDLTILKGIEANILPNGEIDCCTSISKGLDFVMAGFHAPLYLPNSDKDYNTKNLIKVMKKKEVKIISHPGNPHYPIDFKKIAKAAKKYNVALEVNNASINARPGSYDNCLCVINSVKSEGGIISIGSDSHFCEEIGELNNAINLLKECNFPIDLVLNTSKEKVIDFLKG